MRETLWAGASVLVVATIAALWSLDLSSRATSDPGIPSEVSDAADVEQGSAEGDGSVPPTSGPAVLERSLQELPDPTLPHRTRGDPADGPAHLRLRVVDAVHGSALDKARLRLLGSERFAECSPEELGCVDVALRPDEYALTIRAPDHEPREAGTVEFVHGQTVDLGDVALVPGSARLLGRTSAQDVFPEPYRVEMFGPHSESRDVAPGESFSFEGLVAGRYRLSWWRPKRVGVQQSLERELSFGECSDVFLDTEELLPFGLHVRDRAGRPFRGAIRDPRSNSLVLGLLALEFLEGQEKVAEAGVLRGAWFDPEEWAGMGIEEEIEDPVVSEQGPEQWPGKFLSDDPYAACIDRPRFANDSAPPKQPGFPALCGGVRCQIGDPGELRLGPIPARDYELRIRWGDRLVGRIDVRLRTAPLAEYTVALDVAGE